MGRYRLSRGSFKQHLSLFKQHLSQLHLSWPHLSQPPSLQQLWQLRRSAMAPQWLEAMVPQWSVGMVVMAQASSGPQPSFEQSVGKITAFRLELGLSPASWISL